MPIIATLLLLRITHSRDRKITARRRGHNWSTLHCLHTS